MFEVSFTTTGPEGTHDIQFTGEKLSFGRGSEADQRFADDGLSRLHATIHREDDNVWIVDENSSNGTFVNGVRIDGRGTPINEGDEIRIGNHVRMTAHFGQTQKIEAAEAPAAAAPIARPAAAAEPIKAGSILPIALIAGAFLVVTLSVAFIAAMVISPGGPEVVQNRGTAPEEDDDDIGGSKPSPTPRGTDTKTDANSGNVGSNGGVPGDTPLPPSGGGPQYTPPSGKKYLDMSDSERRQYLADRAMKLAQQIGNSSSEAIPPAAVDKIKSFTDAYAKRIGVKPLSGCRFGDNLQVTYERASKNAPFIIHAFNSSGTDPRIGLYLAMIESEHCVCLQSPTGPLGMFQFAFATAKMHFTPSDGLVKGATPSSPDDRCKPEPAARGAASYMKALTGRYGTGPASVPLAIGSYNSGEGGLSTNLVKALESDKGLPRDFWTLIANGDKLSKQFQAENFKYVPKFFAAAIIGENPQDFGLKLQPLTTYTK